MKIVLVDSEWGVLSSELVKQVQEAIDPVNTQGTGVGLAPDRPCRHGGRRHGIEDRRVLQPDL